MQDWFMYPFEYLLQNHGVKYDNEVILHLNFFLCLPNIALIFQIFYRPTKTDHSRFIIVQ